MINQQIQHSGSTSLDDRRPDRDNDSLWIGIERAADRDGAYFQATLLQRGGVALGGPFRQREQFAIADVRALRNSYAQQLQLLHELAAAGAPAPPPDMGRLIDLGRRVAAILPLTTRQGIVAAVQRAQRLGRGLRITLEVAPDEATKQL